MKAHAIKDVGAKVRQSEGSNVKGVWISEPPCRMILAAGAWLSSHRIDCDRCRAIRGGYRISTVVVYLRLTKVECDLKIIPGKNLRMSWRWFNPSAYSGLTVSANYRCIIELDCKAIRALWYCNLKDRDWIRQPICDFALHWPPTFQHTWSFLYIAN